MKKCGSCEALAHPAALRARRVEPLPRGIVGARLALGVAVASLGCGPALALRDGAQPLSPARLVALPVSVLEFQVGASEAITPRWDWTRQAQRNVEEALARRLSAHGGRFVDGAAANRLPAYVDFRRWSEVTLREIIGELKGRLPHKHRSVSEWRYDPGLAAWREPLRADFVLISFFFDGHDTWGRKTVNAFALAPSDPVHAVKRDIACAVELATGRLAWCAFNPGGMYWLIDPANAELAVDQLLRPLWPGDAPAPPTPQPTEEPPPAAARETPAGAGPAPAPAAGHLRPVPPMGPDELLTDAVENSR